MYSPPLNYVDEQVSWFIPGVVNKACLPHERRGHPTPSTAEFLIQCMIISSHPKQLPTASGWVPINPGLGILMFCFQDLSANTTTSSHAPPNASQALTLQWPYHLSALKNPRGHLPSGAHFLQTGTLKPKGAEWVIHVYTAP